jgi:hypothetical protein
LAQRTDIQLWLDEIISTPNTEETVVETQIKAASEPISERNLQPHGLWARIKGLIRSPEPDPVFAPPPPEVGPEPATPAPLENKRDDPIIPLRYIFPERFRGTVFGLDMYDVLRRSRVTFNRHINLDVAEVGNMRMFEATGVGACLLTDTGRNMRDFFEPDTEVLTYESVDECIEKYRYVLDHEDARRAIAAAGQRRTLKDHTMNQRCQAIDIIIRQLL